MSHFLEELLNAGQWDRKVYSTFSIVMGASIFIIVREDWDPVSDHHVYCVCILA